MTPVPAVLALGLADERLVAGTSGVRAEWRALGVEPPGDGRAFRAIFGQHERARGRGERLPRAARDETALVVETERGSLDADLEFAASLGPGPARGAVFVYTLPSASLGEVALRHGLRGPAICLSIGAGRSGEALHEARRLIEDEEAPFALAGCVEVLGQARGGLGGALRAVVALIGAAEGVAAVAAWPAGADPFAELARRAAGGAT